MRQELSEISVEPSGGVVVIHTTNTACYNPKLTRALIGIEQWLDLGNNTIIPLEDSTITEEQLRQMINDTISSETENRSRQQPIGFTLIYQRGCEQLVKLPQIGLLANLARHMTKFWFILVIPLDFNTVRGVVCRILNNPVFENQVDYRLVLNGNLQIPKSVRLSREILQTQYNIEQLENLPSAGLLFILDYTGYREIFVTV